jgi:hypothetical protein
MIKPFGQFKMGTGFSDNIMQLFFPNSHFIITACENGTIITANPTLGGFTFYKTTIPNTSTINQLSFVGKYGWMTGLYGVLIKTTNMGSIWKKSFIDITEGNSIQFMDTSTGYICGSNGTMLKTTDGGTTWNKLFTRTTNTLSKMLFMDNNNGWVVGANGLIMKTENGGGSIATDITDESINLPKAFSLSQNYPNPFNPTTNINYTISERCSVSIRVFNILGKVISILLNEEKGPGNYSIHFEGNGEPSGIYFYRIQAGGFSETKKMILLK